MSTADDAEPVGTLTYERARSELAGTVRALEAGGIPLEDSLALWERGEALAARCEELLDGARARVEAATADGGPDLVPVVHEEPTG